MATLLAASVSSSIEAVDVLANRFRKREAVEKGAESDGVSGEMNTPEIEVIGIRLG